jgi:WD40 repeat protein
MPVPFICRRSVPTNDGSAPQDGTALSVFWDAQTGESQRDWLHHSGVVRDLMWSADSTRLLTASPGGVQLGCGIWERTMLRAGVVLMTARCSRWCFSPDGTRLAVLGLKQGARIWNLTNDSPEIVLQHPSRALMAAWPDNRRIVTSCSDDHLRTWEAGSGRLLESVPLEGGVRDRFTEHFSPGGTFFVPVLPGRPSGVWNVSDGKLHFTLGVARGQGGWILSGWKVDRFGGWLRSADLGSGIRECARQAHEAGSPRRRGHSQPGWRSHCRGR